MSAPLAAAAGSSGSGHPLWHLAAVAAAPFLTFAAVRLFEGWKQRKSRPSALTPMTLAVAILGFAASAIHLSVCREHFREWFVYGVFFVAASVFQAAWSVLVLVRPSRNLFLLGALANDGVVLLFIVSRTTGMPFGPEAFQPEQLTTAGVAATICELALVVGACWRARQLGIADSARTSRPTLFATSPVRPASGFVPRWRNGTEPSVADASVQMPYPMHRAMTRPLRVGTPSDDDSPVRSARPASAAASPQIGDPQ